MSERAAKVEQLHLAGFPFGPPADATCANCPHRWGDHLLYPIYPDNPFAGGMLNCPDCWCNNTWSIDIPEWTEGRCKTCGAHTRTGHDPFPYICLNCVLRMREDKDA
jgi:hypothetical protein